MKRKFEWNLAQKKWVFITVIIVAIIGIWLYTEYNLVKVEKIAITFNGATNGGIAASINATNPLEETRKFQEYFIGDVKSIKHQFINDIRISGWVTDIGYGGAYLDVTYVWLSEQQGNQTIQEIVKDLQSKWYTYGAYTQGVGKYE